MIPGTYDLKLYRGDTWRGRFQLSHRDSQGATTPADLTGASVAAEIRDKTNGTVVTVLATTVTLPNLIDVELSPDLWDLGVPLTGVWDLEVTMGDGTVNTIVAGKVTVTADVTNPPAMLVREVGPSVG